MARAVRNNVPLRAGKHALRGNWVDLQIRRNGKPTYHNSFSTSLQAAADNMVGIARAGRARWKVENEGCNCLARHGYHLKRNFGHGKRGLGNLLATLHLLAFTLHSVLDCLSDLWQQCRHQAGTRRGFFHKLGSLTEEILFPDWTALLETMPGQRKLPAVPT